MSFFCFYVDLKSTINDFQLFIYKIDGFYHLLNLIWLWVRTASFANGKSRKIFHFKLTFFFIYKSKWRFAEKKSSYWLKTFITGAPKSPCAFQKTNEILLTTVGNVVKHFQNVKLPVRRLTHVRWHFMSAFIVFKEIVFSKVSSWLTDGFAGKVSAGSCLIRFAKRIFSGNQKTTKKNLYNIPCYIQFKKKIRATNEKCSYSFHTIQYVNDRKSF